MPRRFAEPVAVGLIVFLGQEARRAVVSALDDVMRGAGEVQAAVATDHEPDYNCGSVELKEVAMSTVSVRIDEGLVSAARAAAKAEFRTVQGQVEFWAKVGRAALDNPDLPASFIAESLMSMAEPREDSAVFVPRSAAKA